MTATDLLRRGLQAQNEGRIAAAIDLYLDALRREPENPQACRLLGEIALHSGQYAHAAQMLSRAAARLPREAAIHVNLGAAHQALEAWDAAATSYRRALALDPRLTAARSNLATILIEQGDVAAAEREYRAALAHDPRFTDAHINLGNLLRNRGDMAEAIACYRRAIACAPNHPLAHNNLGGALLASEMWAEGWAEFEWRWHLGDNPALRARYPFPLWSGEDLTGHSILLWPEQGIGDIVLFATMLPDLVEAGARITLELEPRLVPLFARAFPTITVLPAGTVPAEAAFDYQANLGRLGLFLRSHAEAFANNRPYLLADPARRAVFRTRYDALGPGPKIGLAWRSTSPTHRRKSLALDSFAPLFAARPDALFVSLQYGDTAAERAQVRQRFGVDIHHDDSFDNWTDLDGLAAQIAALDHVVTVSNLNAHFAGALGVPAHVLLTQNTLWYWPHAKPTTPWYKNLTLVRTADQRALAALTDFFHARR